MILAAKHWIRLSPRPFFAIKQCGFPLKCERNAFSFQFDSVCLFCVCVCVHVRVDRLGMGGVSLVEVKLKAKTNEKKEGKNHEEQYMRSSIWCNNKSQVDSNPAQQLDKCAYSSFYEKFCRHYYYASGCV